MTPSSARSTAVGELAAAQRSPVRSTMRRRHRHAAATAAWLVVALALAARLFRADAQSLWYDEGTSAELATRTAREIVAAAAGDIHPPLYYLLLAAWSRLFGHGVVALRALSAVLGTAQVAATVAIGRRLGGARLGLVAGLLAATSPYLIWYGQEVRMYVLAGALGACLVALAVGDVDPRIAPGGGQREGVVVLRPASAVLRTALITVLATAALYTQYLAGAAAVAVGGVVVALGWLAEWRRNRVLAGASIARWLGAYAVAGALFAPWLIRAWPALRDWPALGAPVGLAFVAREAVITYAFGVRAPAAWRGWWVVMGVVGVAGVAWAWRPGTARGGRRSDDLNASPRRGAERVGAMPASGSDARQRSERCWAAMVTVLFATTPPALVWLASLRRPAWNPKFIVAGAPGFELLLALGVVGIAEAARALWAATGDDERRRRGGAVVGTALGAIALAIVVWPRLAVWHANAYDAAYQRDDYRGIAAEIAARAGPADAVVLDAPTQIEVFGYYDRGAHATFPLPIGRPVDMPATERRLGDLWRRGGDVYAVLWATNESDPDGVVVRALDDRYAKAEERWFGNVRLAVWTRPDPAIPFRPVGDRPIVFADALSLSLALSSASDGAMHVVAGGFVQLAGCWTAIRAAPPDVVVFTQLIGPAGDLVATRDMRPHGGSAATSTWPPRPRAFAPPVDGRCPAGHTLDRIALRVPPDTPPGDSYRLILGLYDPATGRRLPLDAGGDAFEVATATVTGSR